ncbi:MAG: hypothetical protein ACRDZ2_03660 [Ilumatobacteraceae bacterium]
MSDDDVAAQYQRAYPQARFGSDTWGELDQWHQTAAGERTVDRDPW